MKVRGVVLMASVLLATCRCGAKTQPAPQKNEQPSHGNPLPEVHEAARPVKANTEQQATDASAKKVARGHSRRRTLEGLSKRDHLLLAMLREATSPVVRSDGLLQRRVSLEVSLVLAGKQSRPVVHAYEIVPLRREFMSKERKEQVVNLVPCLEEGGQERLVVYSAHVPSATELRELTEDARTYSPQEDWDPLPCSIGTSPAMKKHLEDVEADGRE